MPLLSVPIVSYEYHYPSFSTCIDIICLCVCLTHPRERVFVLLIFVSLAPTPIPSAQLMFVKMDDNILPALSAPSVEGGEKFTTIFRSQTFQKNRKM